jgi:hypothetical protein
VNIFISYNRQTKAITKALVEDVEALGHTVWFDQELSGGQAWWDQILLMIRRCDLFVFVLDPAALNSIACKREYGYAADLRKPILPILVSEGVSTNLLPPSLSQIEFVDYRNQDRTAALRLARAFIAIPSPAALPDPLPVPPEAPLSYLGSLAAKLETTSILTYEEQSALVFDLKKALRDPETADDTRILLKTFRKRRDLLAGIADEMDELFKGLRETSSAQVAPPKLEQMAEPIYQEPQETNVSVQSDASTAPRAKVESRVSSRRTRPGWLSVPVIAQFDRDLLIFATKWTLACLLGEVVGQVAGHTSFIQTHLPWNYRSFIGVAIGVTQWVVLRRRIRYSPWWILVTTVGWAPESLLQLSSFILEHPSSLIAKSVTCSMLLGIAVGTMQWLVLRRSVSRAAWWILIVSIAAGLGAAAALSSWSVRSTVWEMAYLHAYPSRIPEYFTSSAHVSFWESTLRGAIEGAVSGVITGLGLGILLRRTGKGLQPSKQESSA